MEFTKDEIVSKRFKSSLKGYDKLEVEVYLEWLADQVEDLQRENEGLQNRIDEMEEDFEGLADEKEKFGDKQLKVSKQIEQMKKDAEKFTEQQKQQARLDAQNALKESYTMARELKSDIDKLKKIKESFVERYTTFIHDQYEIIKAFQHEKIPLDDKKKGKK